MSYPGKESFDKWLEGVDKQIAQLDEEQRQIDELAKDTYVFVDAALTLLEVNEREAAREADTTKAEMDRLTAEMEKDMQRTEELMRQSRAMRGK